jgi:hypothetical protein
VAYDNNLVLGLNLFTANKYVINLLPDYEAVGTLSLPITSAAGRSESMRSGGSGSTLGLGTLPGNGDSWPELRDTLNSSLLGWSNYFCHGTRRSAFRSVDQYVYDRVRDFLARRHKVAGRGTHRFSRDVVYGELGLLRLERLSLTAPTCASR